MSKKRKLICVVASAALALSLTLVGCGGGGGSTDTNSTSDTSNSATNGTTADFTTVTPGVLTVGSDCDYPPFIQMNGAQPEGFEYDLMTAVADQLGLKLQYLPPQNFDTLLASVASGVQLDLGVSSFTITDDRKQLVDFSIPYFDSNQACVTMTNSSYTSAMDLNGLTVGAQSGTTGADWVRENLTDPGTVLKEFNSTSEVMAALVAGDLQGAFYDEPVAAEFVKTNYTNTHIVESIPTGEQYGIAVSKDNPGLLKALNDALVTLKQNGTFDQIFLKYFSDLTPPSIKPVS